MAVLAGIPAMEYPEWFRPVAEMQMRLNSLPVPVCTGIPVSRKKILTMTHPPVKQEEQARCTNVDPCALIRPTLSACCDDSQLLLGISLPREGSTNQGIPTAKPSSLCLEVRFRRKRKLLPTQSSDQMGGFAKDILISASLIIA
jgi:hypothetical protein